MTLSTTGRTTAVAVLASALALALTRTRDDGTQHQLIALGPVLVLAALLDGRTPRRFTGSR
jgi:hypothetical protein